MTTPFRTCSTTHNSHLAHLLYRMSALIIPQFFNVRFVLFTVAFLHFWSGWRKGEGWERIRRYPVLGAMITAYDGGSLHILPLKKLGALGARVGLPQTAFSRMVSSTRSLFSSWFSRGWVGACLVGITGRFVAEQHRCVMWLVQSHGAQ